MNLNKLKGKVAEQGKNQKELMDTLGLKYVAINKKFNGKTKFTTEEISKIKDVLSLTNDEVVEIFLS